MTKGFKTYLIVWGIALALYAAVSLISVWRLAPAALANLPLLGFGVAALVVQLVCAYLTLGKSDDSHSVFLGMPLLTFNSVLTVLLVAASLICGLLPLIPLWIGIVVCCIILAVDVASCASIRASTGYIGASEEATAASTATMRGFVAKSSTLASSAKTDEGRASARRVYEALRFSDPVSSPATAGIDNSIAHLLDALSGQISSGSSTSESEDELLALISERNAICKLNK